MEWLLIYKDEKGIEKTKIYNDGENLSTVVRGITYEGKDFDCLKPISHKNEDKSLLTSNFNELNNCELVCTIKIAIQDREELVSSNLQMELNLGKPLVGDGLGDESLKLRLYYKNQCIRSRGDTGEFEYELLSIQKQLEDGIYMKVCINCAYSDYSPYGHGLFGNMMCFKTIKQRYLSVKSKKDLLLIHDDYDRYVQETYLCDEFTRRITGTGYRG